MPRSTLPKIDGWPPATIHFSPLGLRLASYDILADSLRHPRPPGAECNRTCGVVLPSRGSGALLLDLHGIGAEPEKSYSS